MREIFIAVTVDIDPDNYDTAIFGPETGLSWRGVEEGLPILFELAARVVRDLGVEPRFTWFVRADSELSEAYGSSLWLLDTYADLWRRRRQLGDEIAWHPHERGLDALVKTHDALAGTGEAFSSVRLGHAVHSNEMMSQLSEWGFSVDSSALPGRMKSDGEPAFNWMTAPAGPYFPSAIDYRRPGAEPGGLLEVPFTMISTRAAYDGAPLKRYFNLSFKPEAIVENLRDLAAEADLLVLILHPSELLAAPRGHGLLSFSPEAVVANLEAILDAARAVDKVAKFITIGETLALVKGERIAYAPN